MKSKLMKAACLTIALGFSVFLCQGQMQHIRIGEENSFQKTKDSPTRVIQSNPESVEMQYQIPSISSGKILAKNGIEYDIVRLQNFGLRQKVGHPALPVRTEKIAIPANTTPSITIINSDYTELSGFHIFPAQEPPSDQRVSNTPFALNTNVYSRNAFTPQSIAVLIDQQIFKGTELAFIQIRPVQYNPSTGTIRVYTNLSIRVNFVPIAEKRVRKITKQHQQTNVLTNVIINPRDFQKHTKRATSIQPQGYILVTVPEFEQAAQMLANWKSQLGYHVQILSQNSWTINQVKTAVENIYQQPDYEYNYLLLLGDQEHIPDYFYENTYLDPILPVHSTNYYACMDGPNDYIPEMAHGRIPIQNADQANTIMQKIIDYEKNPPQMESFYTKGLHAGYFEDSLQNGVSDKRYARTSIEMHDYMTDEQGFESDILLYTEPGVNPEYFLSYYSDETVVPDEYKRENGYPWDADRNDIINAINEGRLYAFHRDHGRNWGWVQPEFHVDDIDRLNNGNLTPFIFSVNCGSGSFFYHEPNMVSFAEKMLRHPNGGAVGVIAATEETRSGYNDGLIIGMMDAIWSDPGIIPNLGSSMGENPGSSPHAPIHALGDVLIQGLIRMTETWDPAGWADRDHFHLYHYFGDPAMRAWSEIPTTLTATHQSYMHLSETSFTIHSSNCPGALATLCKDGQILSLASLHDGSGTLQLKEPLSDDTHLFLTLSAPNFSPYVTEIEVSAEPVLRIMPLGNSLTSDERTNDTRIPEDKCGYRAHLSDLLTELSIPFDFVGSRQNGTSCISDSDHAGFPGMTSTQLIHLLQTGFNQRENIQETPSFYLDSYTPQVILLHIGSNSVTHDVSSLEVILDEINAYKLRTGIECKTIVAKILNQVPNNPDITTYNTNMDSMITTRNDNSIFLVDMEDEAGIIYALEPDGDMYDQYHPTPEGYVKMAQEWIDPIASMQEITTNTPQFLNVKDIHTFPGDTVYLDMHSFAMESPTLSLENMTGSMEFTPELGILEWTPEMEGIYTLKLTASNNYTSNSESFTLTINSDNRPPAIPQEFSGILQNDNTVYLNWEETSNTYGNYEIERSINGGDYVWLASLPIDSTSYTDSDLIYNTEYQYRLRAVNSMGNSGFKLSESIYVPTPPEPLIVGYNTVFDSPTYNNSRRSQQVTMPHDGILQSVVMYHGAGGGSLIYAVYDDNNGTPGNRLAQTPITATSSTAGWQEVNLQTPIFIPKGTTIWLAWIYQYQPEIRYTNGGPGRASSPDTYSSGMPTQFGSSSISSYSYAIHALYTPYNTEQPPSSPSLLTASYQGITNQTILSWEDNSNNEDHFIIQRSINGGTYIEIAQIASDVVGYTDNDILPNTEYIYRITASNVYGNSEYNESNPIYTEASPPSAPVDVILNQTGNNEILVTWTDMSDNEIEFQIERAENGSSYSLVQTVSANTESTVNTIDHYNTPYQYRVRAMNTFGASEYSLSELLSVPIPSDPLIVGYNTIFDSPTYNNSRRAQQVTMPQDGTIHSVIMYHGAGSGSLIYAIYDDDNGVPGNRLAQTPVTVTNSTAGWQEVDLEVPIDLVAETTIWLAWVYQYQPEIRYTNGEPGRASSPETYSSGMPTQFGGSSVNNYTYAIHALYTPLHTKLPPASPSQLTASYTSSDNQVILSWEDNSTNEDNFILQRSINGGTYTEIAQIPRNEVHYIDNDMLMNTSYTYRILARNTYGDSDYAIADPVYTDASPPDAPTGIVIEQIATNLIQISWTDMSDNETDFEIERAINGSTFSPVQSTGANITSIESPIEEYNANYQFRVRARNDFGNSNFSTSPLLYIPDIPDIRKAGYEEVFSSPIYTSNRRAQRITMPESGTVYSICMYHGSGSGSLRYGIYNDENGQPGSQLAQTAVTPTSSLTGWQEVELQEPIHVDAGIEIWLAFVYQYPPEIRYTTAGPGRAHSEDTWINGMPQHFGYSAINDYRYSIYANYRGVETNSPPLPPVNPQISYFSSSAEIYLQWTDNSRNEENFIIERSKDSGSFTPHATLNANESSFTDIDVEYNSTYQYRIYASNTFGNSTYSDTIEVFTYETTLNPIDIGYPHIFPYSVTLSDRRAQPITSTTSGTIESISMYLNPINDGNYRFAVYSDYQGSPDQLLGSTSITSKNSSPSWHTANLATPVRIDQNQQVWLAWMFDQPTEAFYDYGAPGRAYSGQYWSGEFPVDFGSSAIVDYIYSIYMTITPDASKHMSNIGMSNSVQDPVLFIYPNPVVGSALYISINNQATADTYQLEIQDISGRSLLREQIYLEPEQSHPCMLKSSINESILILKLRNATNQYVQKLIIQQ